MDGNLGRALRRIVPDWSGKRVLDLGTGTGRLTLLLAGEARQFTGVDLHQDMLRENRAQRALAGGRWFLAQADMRALPFAPGAADVVTAGWSIGHLRGWFPDDWQTQIGRVLREMRRLAAPGGTLIIMETMTTGSLTPAPPTPALAEYYAWLENEWGFQRQIIATDYQFTSVEQAVEYTTFFFGEDLARRIRANNWARLPEWTGVWMLEARGWRLEARG